MSNILEYKDFSMGGSLAEKCYTVKGESFAGLNFHGFDLMKYFVVILLWFIGQECSQL